MLRDVRIHRRRNQIPHTHLSSQEQANLGTAHVILNQLLNDMDIIFPRLQVCQRLVDVRARAFDDKGPVSAENVVEIFLRPDAGCGHGLDEICASEEGNAHLLATGRCADALSDGIDFVIDMVEDESGWLVFFLRCFPWVDHEPVRGLVGGETAHIDSKQGEDVSQIELIDD